MDRTFLTYNALDSACMLEIHNKFWPSLKEDGYEQAYNLTVDLFPVLQFMQEFGMKVDLDLLQETKKEVQEQISSRQVDLDRLCGRPLNVNSPKDCITYFYGELNLPPITDKKSKKLTTNDLAMQRLARGTAKNPGVPQASLVQQVRGLQKLYSTYLNIQFDEDNRMRGSYNPRGTKFGRLSSSKTIRNTGMNFQNLPQEFKKFLVADEDYLLLEVDKRQAEWVVVAYLANDANMIQAIKEGVDVHAYTASLMFGVPIDFVKEENKLVGHTTNPEEIQRIRYAHPEIKDKIAGNWPRTMSLRQCGKKSNHGLNYDEGYKNFALINSIEEREARRIVEMYHSIYPGIRIMYDAIKRQLQKDRTLTNCFGRKVFFMSDWCKDMWKSAYACLPQSTVVDCVNQAMVHMYKDEYLTRTCNINILAQVHDSILLEIPRKIALNPTEWPRIVDKIYTYMSPTLSYNGVSFTIKNDMKMGYNWGEQTDTNKQGMRDVWAHSEVVKHFGSN